MRCVEGANCDTILSIGAEGTSLHYAELSEVGTFTMELVLAREDEKVNKSFTLSVIDGCKDTVPYIDDKSGGELIYEPFSGYKSYAD